MPEQKGDFMDFTITIKEVITVVMLVLGVAGGYYTNRSSVDQLKTDNDYLRKELVDIKEKLKDQQKVNGSVIRLETKIEGIAKSQELILRLLQDRPR